MHGNPQLHTPEEAHEVAAEYMEAVYKARTIDDRMLQRGNAGVALPFVCDVRPVRVRPAHSPEAEAEQ